MGVGDAAAAPWELPKRVGRLRGMRATIALAAGLLLSAFAAAGPAAASCIMPPALDVAISEANIVFVGTVTGVKNNDRTATVLVEEVWKGPDLLPFVEVVGGADDETTMSSIDRTYTTGTRYLFVLHLDQGRFRDNACSSTQEWSPEVAAVRPSTIRTPGQQPDATPTAGPPSDAVPPGGQSVAPIALAATGLAATGLFGAVWLLRRRQGADVSER